MKYLVTGSAGFIGFHLTRRLLEDGHEVIGLDNLNHYYDVSLKLDRLAELGIDADTVAAKRLVRSTRYDRYFFVEADVADPLGLRQLFAEHKFEIVYHLAAQAGVRYSLENPSAYLESNISGFGNVLECCRYFPPQHLVYASSSSVYGFNVEVPFRVTDAADHPVSLYAASKRSNELMAHTYSHLFGLPATGLRFFTVYGEWGRPDMASFLFAKAILTGTPIKLFNNGDMSRDFTYVGDIVDGLIRVASHIPAASPPTEQNPSQGTSHAPHRLFNIGRGEPVQLGAFIDAMERILGRKATKVHLPMQDGDVQHTWADVSMLAEIINYRPTITLVEGLTRFLNWYRQYYAYSN